MKKKKSTSNPTWQAFKQHKRGWLALRILAVLFVVTLLAPLWSNDKPLWIRYQGEYFFPLVNEYNETTFGGDFDTPADYLDPLIRHNITSDGNFALYLPKRAYRNHRRPSRPEGTRQKSCHRQTTPATPNPIQTAVRYSRPKSPCP